MGDNQSRFFSTIGSILYFIGDTNYPFYTYMDAPGGHTV
jgi:hypothetical protein